MKVAIFNSGKDGFISFEGDDVRVSIDNKNHVFKKTSVDHISKISNLSLDRVSALIVFYDMFGDRNELNFDIHSNDFKVLEKTLQ
jgi:hypothetical protein